MISLSPTILSHDLGSLGHAGRPPKISLGVTIGFSTCAIPGLLYRWRGFPWAAGPNGRDRRRTLRRRTETRSLSRSYLERRYDGMDFGTYFKCRAKALGETRPRAYLSRPPGWHARESRRGGV